MVAQPSDPEIQPESPAASVRLAATIADLAQLPDDGFRYELVKGVLLRMPPPKRLHGVICHRLHKRLDAWCAAHGITDDRIVENIGYNFTGEEPNATVLAPDISFAQKATTLAADAPYETTPPLLAVEVASPSESRTYMADKVAIYLRGGVQVVWVIWPEGRTVDVWTQAGLVTLSEHDTLTGGTLLPDFALMVAEIFPAVAS